MNKRPTVSAEDVCNQTNHTHTNQCVLFTQTYHGAFSWHGRFWFGKRNCRGTRISFFQVGFDS